MQADREIDFVGRLQASDLAKITQYQPQFQSMFFSHIPSNVNGLGSDNRWASRDAARDSF